MNISCTDCGSSQIQWDWRNTGRSGVQNGRLKYSEVEPVFFAACQECSATVATKSADQVARLLTAKTQN